MASPGSKPAEQPANDADISTSTGTTGKHIIVKPKLNIESENPLSDDEALMQLIASMPDEVQQDLMDEALFARGFCDHNSFLNANYDCSCFSFRIIGDRIAKGPSVPLFQLIQDGRYGDCVDTSKIAGNGYDRCIGILTYMNLTTEQLNSICECTARTMASSYKKSPTPVQSQMGLMFTDVLTTCRHQVVP